MDSGQLQVQALSADVGPGVRFGGSAFVLSEPTVRVQDALVSPSARDASYSVQVGPSSKDASSLYFINQKKVSTLGPEMMSIEDLPTVGHIGGATATVAASTVAAATNTGDIDYDTAFGGDSNGNASLDHVPLGEILDRLQADDEDGSFDDASNDRNNFIRLHAVTATDEDGEVMNGGMASSASASTISATLNVATLDLRNAAAATAGRMGTVTFQQQLSQLNDVLFTVSSNDPGRAAARGGVSVLTTNSGGGTGIHSSGSSVNDLASATSPLSNSSLLSSPSFSPSLVPDVSSTSTSACSSYLNTSLSSCSSSAAGGNTNCEPAGVIAFSSSGKQLGLLTTSQFAAAGGAGSQAGGLLSTVLSPTGRAVSVAVSTASGVGQPVQLSLEPMAVNKPAVPAVAGGSSSSTTASLSPPQECNLCNKMFANASALTKHRLTHSNERKYLCNVCHKAFKRQDHLNGHLLTHRNKKPFECTTEGCNKSYCDARSLRRHRENHNHHVNSNSSTSVAASSSNLITSSSNVGPKDEKFMLVSPSSSIASDYDDKSESSDTFDSLLMSTKNRFVGVHRGNNNAGTVDRDKAKAEGGTVGLQQGQMTTFNILESYIRNDKEGAASIKAKSQQAGGQVASPSNSVNNGVQVNVQTGGKSTNQTNNNNNNNNMVECTICSRRFKNIPALNGHMRLHGGYFRKDSDKRNNNSGGSDAKNANNSGSSSATSSGPAANKSQSAAIVSTNVKTLIGEKIIQKRKIEPTTLSYNSESGVLSANVSAATNLRSPTTVVGVSSAGGHPTHCFKLRAVSLPPASSSPSSVCSNFAPANSFVVSGLTTSATFSNMDAQSATPTTFVTMANPSGNGLEPPIKKQMLCVEQPSSVVPNASRQPTISLSAAIPNSGQFRLVKAHEQPSVNCHSVKSLVFPILQQPDTSKLLANLQSGQTALSASLSLPSVPLPNSICFTRSVSTGATTLVSSQGKNMLPRTTTINNLSSGSTIASTSYNPGGVVKTIFTVAPNITGSSSLSSQLLTSSSPRLVGASSRYSPLYSATPSPSPGAAAAANTGMLLTATLLPNSSSSPSSSSTIINTTTTAALSPGLFASASPAGSSSSSFSGGALPSPIYHLPPVVSASSCGSQSPVKSAHLSHLLKLGQHQNTDPRVGAEYQVEMPSFPLGRSNNASVNANSNNRYSNHLDDTGFWSTKSDDEALAGSLLCAASMEHPDDLTDDEGAGDVLMWSPDCAKELTSAQIDDFVKLCGSVAVPSRMEIGPEAALQLLTRHGGNILKATQSLLTGEAARLLSGVAAGESSAWEAEEVNMFYEALVKNKKDFVRIADDIPGKTAKECVEFYYRWKSLCREESQSFKGLMNIVADAEGNLQL